MCVGIAAAIAFGVFVVVIVANAVDVVTIKRFFLIRKEKTKGLNLTPAEDYSYTAIQTASQGSVERIIPGQAQH